MMYNGKSLHSVTVGARGGGGHGGHGGGRGWGGRGRGWGGRGWRGGATYYDGYYGGYYNDGYYGYPTYPSVPPPPLRPDQLFDSPMTPTQISNYCSKMYAPYCQIAPYSQYCQYYANFCSQ